MPFEPGNKHGKGRPKGSINGATRAKEYLEQEGGWDKLLALVGSEEESIQLRTLEVLLERAYGKAPQALKHSGIGGQSPMITGDFLIALADRINAQRLSA